MKYILYSYLVYLKKKLFQFHTSTLCTEIKAKGSHKQPNAHVIVPVFSLIFLLIFISTGSLFSVAPFWFHCKMLKGTLTNEVRNITLL